MRARIACLLLLAACTDPPPPVDAAVDDASAARDAPMRVDAAVMHPQTDAPLKGPFVMQPTTTSVVVRWETVLQPAHVEVDYAPQAGGTMQTATGTARLTPVLLDYRGNRD